MSEIEFTPRTLLMDFYAVAGAQFEFIDAEAAPFVFTRDEAALRTVVSDPDLAEAATGLRSRTIDAMQKTLVRDVLFVLAAEVRHIYDKGALKPSRTGFFSKNFGPVGRKWFFIYDAIYRHGGTGLDCKPVVPEPPLDRQPSGYLQSYVAGVTASRETGLPFHEVAERVFDRSAGAKWSANYGGKAWLEIAKAYREVLTAVTEDQIVLAADRLISLEHNTSTLFTKCSHWALGGDWAWIKECLDIKFSASSPVAFLGLCSEPVRHVVLGLHTSGRVFSSPGGPLRAHLAGERPSEVQDTQEDGSPKEGDAFSLDSVGEGDLLVLQYEGADRQFQVEAVHALGYGHRAFIMSSKGWADHKGVGPGGRPVVIDLFAMTGEEIEARFVGRQEAGEVEKAKRLLSQFVMDIHLFVEGTIKLEKPLLAVGSVQLAEYGFRFRIKGPGGVNFRIYATVSEKDLIVLCGTTKYPAENPQGEELFEQFPREKAEDTDFLAAFGRRLIQRAVEALARAQG